MTDPVFEKPISDLRRRMLQDMSNRNFVDKTKHDYIRHVEALAKFLDRSPDTATADDVRQFQADQIAGAAQPSKMNTQASALRFFFTITLGRPDLANQLARTHYPRKLPRVLSPEDVGRRCHINVRWSQKIYDYPISSGRCHVLPSLHRSRTKLPKCST